VAEDIARQRREFATVCRRLSAARRRVEELEYQRNALMYQLRRGGERCSELAQTADLSPGRVSQIVGKLVAVR
jgi:hypothetical protein